MTATAPVPDTVVRAPAATVPASAGKAPTASVAASKGTGCAACWGAGALTPGQAINTVVNHLFNSTFNWLSTLPGNPIANLLEGVLVLVRRSLFLIPEGVTAAQVGNSLAVSVNTGSVAYFRQEGTSLQISGDPSFQGARTFDASTALTVEVTNSPGNAGCAGVVVESGIVNGSLTTSQIDAIRFAAGSAFAGSVESVVSGGALVLRDAVRGLDGVVLDAPVVLANDVEVDAGRKNADFLGTVDAAQAGEQSLTVTALGATTFKAAVGGQAPLANLLTRGIAPLNIQQSTDTRSVPLHFLPQFAPNGQAQVKYGIDVAVGDNPSQVYEFDTGGNAFWAGYNPSFFSNVPLTSVGVSDVYSSGNYYDGVVVNVPIRIGQGTQKISTAQPVAISAILAGGNSNNGQVFDFTNPLVPPVESHFFGDFGAAFGTVPVTGLDSPLTSVLFQLPGNLSSGFLVQLGPIGVDPRLTVGITDDLRAQFPYAIPVSALTGAGTYPVSGYQVLQQFGFAAEYFAQKGDGEEKPIGEVSQCTGAICLPSLIDSGAPSTGIRLKGQGGAQYEQGGQLQPGVDLIAKFPTTQGRQPLEWTFTAGDIGSVDLVQYQTGSAASDTQNVNTGLNLYNYYDIMFDVAKQVIWLRPTGGQSNVTAGSVTTSGDQTYRQNATLSGTYNTGGGKFSVAGGAILGGDTVVNAGAGDVTFSGTVDGPHALAVNSRGATDFVRQVGGQDALQNLTTDAGGSTATASVLTRGDQTYGDPLSMNGKYVLTDGSFTAAADAQLTGPVTITADNPSSTIDFNGRIDAEDGRGYSLAMSINLGGRVNLNGDVGSTHPLGGLSVTSSPLGFQTATFSAKGAIALDGSLGFSAQDGLSLSFLTGTQLNAGGRIQNFSSGNGIVLTQPGSTQIGNLVISNNKNDGVKVIGASDLNLSTISVIANGGNGVEIIDSANVNLSNNSITGNAGNGVQITDSANVGIASSTVKSSGGDGISSKRSATVGITGSSIYQNAGTGVVVDQDSSGNAILSNSIYANGGSTGLGITLINGGNADQPAPRIRSVGLNGSTLTVNTTVNASAGYSGTFTVQVFYTAPGAQTAPQGQQLLYTATSVAAGDQRLSFAVSGLVTGGTITVTATPDTGPRNTSAFSNGESVPA